MNIKIQRTHCTRLYTQGKISVNNIEQCSTEEYTLGMLPAGTYDVKLRTGEKRRRIIAIMASPIKGMPNVPNTLSRFEAGGSWISAKKNRSICLGTDLIPGALKKGTEPYERLFDRIEKAEQRGESITLTITEEGMTNGEPISHWLTSHHA